MYNVYNTYHELYNIMHCKGQQEEEVSERERDYNSKAMSLEIIIIIIYKKKSSFLTIFVNHLFMDY